MINIYDIDRKLEELRKRYVTELSKREVIKRQARALKISREMALKKVVSR
ncbi:MAG: hypothetical protein KW793_04590 [Candidatus Doudnabacteria bacterium]|nr:hypothetical protein [Candidatus Doudnabacteria bacterium]